MTMIIITPYLSLRPTKEALDSIAKVPVIPVRNSDEGESLTKLARVFMCGDKLLESLGNDDGDANENGKKAIGLDWQNNDSARQSHVLVNFPTVTTRVQRENA